MSRAVVVDHVTAGASPDLRALRGVAEHAAQRSADVPDDNQLRAGRRGVAHGGHDQRQRPVGRRERARVVHVDLIVAARLDVYQQLPAGDEAHVAGDLQGSRRRRVAPGQRACAANGHRAADGAVAAAQHARGHTVSRPCGVRPVHEQRAGIHRCRAGVGVGAAEHQRAGAGLDHRVRARKGQPDGRRLVADRERAGPAGDIQRQRTGRACAEHPVVGWRPVSKDQVADRARAVQGYRRVRREVQGAEMGRRVGPVCRHGSEPVARSRPRSARGVVPGRNSGMQVHVVEVDGMHRVAVSVRVVEPDSCRGAGRDEGERLPGPGGADRKGKHEVRGAGCKARRDGAVRIVHKRVRDSARRADQHLQVRRPRGGREVTHPETADVGPARYRPEVLIRAARTAAGAGMQAPDSGVLVPVVGPVGVEVLHPIRRRRTAAGVCLEPAVRGTLGTQAHIVEVDGTHGVAVASPVVETDSRCGARRDKGERLPGPCRAVADRKHIVGRTDGETRRGGAVRIVRKRVRRGARRADQHLHVRRPRGSREVAHPEAADVRLAGHRNQVLILAARTVAAAGMQAEGPGVLVAVVGPVGVEVLHPTRWS